jgi:hypothetical protein
MKNVAGIPSAAGMSRKAGVEEAPGPSSKVNATVSAPPGR